MSKDMLGSLTRASVGVPKKYLELGATLLNLLGTTNLNNTLWYQHLTAVTKAGLPSRPQPLGPTEMVHVDRFHPLKYPDFADPKWLKNLFFLKLEASGPDMYTLDEIEEWVHPDQLGEGKASGHAIYNELRRVGLQRKCLSLADLLSIKRLGPMRFNEYFSGKQLCAWKSVVPDTQGLHHVPYLSYRDNELRLSWISIDRNWSAEDVAPYFR